MTMETTLSRKNTRERVDNYGFESENYDYTNFTLKEMLHHTGLYLYHNLSPSTQVEMNCQS